MSWTYCQRTGDFFLGGYFVARGYSGFGSGRDDPSAQAIADIGPIPVGGWTISGPPFESDTHGPFVLRLEPDEDTITFGRRGFLIHGDSFQHPGEASQGCIVLPREVREAVWSSGDMDLQVVAELKDVDVTTPPQGVPLP